MSAEQSICDDVRRVAGRAGCHDVYGWDYVSWRSVGVDPFEDLELLVADEVAF